MPSRRQRAAMLSSPRSPSSTTRILSSAECCLRVARRMSRTTRSAGGLATVGSRVAGAEDFGLIFTPCGYDEPEILRSSMTQFCLIGADAGQLNPLLGLGLGDEPS